jgi:hypothetical protein
VGKFLTKEARRIALNERGACSVPPNGEQAASRRGLCADCHETGMGLSGRGVLALLETLRLKGCIVTMDAPGCQTEVTRKVLERGGDYLLAVKENKPSMPSCRVPHNCDLV